MTIELPPKTHEDQAILIRTDFSDDATWGAVVAEAGAPQPVQFPYNDDPENAFSTTEIMVVEDRRCDAMLIEELLAVLPGSQPTDEELQDPNYKFDGSAASVYVANSVTMTHPEHPILALDLYIDRGMKFWLAPGSISLVNINLVLGNLGFSDFGDTDETDTSEIFRD